MIDTQAVTQASRDVGDAGSLQLNVVPSELPRAPRRRVVGRPFERNNRMQCLRRVPPDSIAELDEVARDTVRRLRVAGLPMASCVRWMLHRPTRFSSDCGSA